jgi:hypothetical protein
MSLKRPSADLDLERDLPTTSEDVRAQRENRPRAGSDWLEQLQALSTEAAASGCTPRPRRTFAGFEPFEL